jgi:hypothetical protein
MVVAWSGVQVQASGGVVRISHTSAETHHGLQAGANLPLPITPGACRRGYGGGGALAAVLGPPMS